MWNGMKCYIHVFKRSKWPVRPRNYTPWYLIQYLDNVKPSRFKKKHYIWNLIYINIYVCICEYISYLLAFFEKTSKKLGRSVYRLHLHDGTTDFIYMIAVFTMPKDHEDIYDLIRATIHSSPSRAEEMIVTCKEWTQFMV